MSQRKAQNKNTPFTAEMAEVYFGAIKEDFDGLRSDFDGLKSYVDKRLDTQDQKLGKIQETLKTILGIVNIYDQDKKEIKLNLWEHDRRLLKLEKQLS